MADDLFPFPELPPLPADPGEYLTNFVAHLHSTKFDRNGNLQLIFTVDPTDKYKAIPLTDIRGRNFTVSVYADRGRTPLVQRGTLGVYAAQMKVKERRADRAWKTARRELFDGLDDD